jgi:uncharacterized Zn-binding protein involved in type VI secretion
MRGVARLGDCTHGICYEHSTPIKVSGKIISASSDTYCDTLGIARLGDTVLANCGHTGTIISASENTKCNDLGIARLGDNIAGKYVATIISASTTAFVNTIYVTSGSVYVYQGYNVGDQIDVISGDYLTLEDGVTPLLSEDSQPLLI